VLPPTLALAASAALWAPRAPVPLLRRLPPDVMEAYETRFRPFGAPPVKGVPTVSESQVLALWKALVRAFGGKSELALQAVKANPTVVHPLYTRSPELITASRAALREVIESEAEAIEIMIQNPSILQCGDGIRLQEASQIKSFAAFRGAVDRIPPALSQGTLALFAAVLLSNFALVRSDDPALATMAATVKPVLGVVFATLFGATTALATTAESNAAAARRER